MEYDEPQVYFNIPALNGIRVAVRPDRDVRVILILKELIRVRYTSDTLVLLRGVPFQGPASIGGNWGYSYDIGPIKIQVAAHRLTGGRDLVVAVWKWSVLQPDRTK